MSNQNTVRIRPWDSEKPLRLAVMAFSTMAWVAIIASIFGAIYAVVLGVMFFFLHVAFIGHIRGNGVKLGEQQFPEIYQRVQALAKQAGMQKAPDTYLMESGGMLNAMATKFLGSDILVVYADLLEACGDNHAARDMILGHELGHVHAGHLRFFAFSLPGRMIPFLGHAYSRACEYTCDRYGIALSCAAGGEKRDAVQGLSILAAGRLYGRKIDKAAFVAQKHDLDTGFMSIATWLSTHPPLCDRISVLEPELGGAKYSTGKGALRGFGILAAFYFVPMICIFGAIALFAGLASMKKDSEDVDLTDTQYQIDESTYDSVDEHVDEH